MRKILFRLKIITRWLRAIERAARYKRQRDVLYRNLSVLLQKYCLFEPLSKDLDKILDEIERE